MIATERRSISRHWNKLRKRADRAPHGTKLQRRAELKTFVHEELKREVAA